MLVDRRRGNLPAAQLRIERADSSSAIDEGRQLVLFDTLPLWLLFLLTVVITLSSVELGNRIARRRRQRSEEKKEAPAAGMVGATLGLLAFMLAFTFGMAASRFDTRRQLVFTEANAIGTAYLRAGLLPEPMRTESRSLLRQYVDTRLAGAQPGKTAQAIAKSEELHNLLWAQAVALAEKERTAITSLFIQSINSVIELHTARVTALQNRIPGAIWLGLYLLAILAMSALGYQEGSASDRRSLASFALVIAFSAVLILIANLDRPGQGLLQVSQQSMIELQKSMTSQ